MTILWEQVLQWLQDQILQKRYLLSVQYETRNTILIIDNCVSRSNVVTVKILYEIQCGNLFRPDVRTDLGNKHETVISYDIKCCHESGEAFVILNVI